MKLSALFLLAFCLQLSARTTGQTITLNFKNVPVQNVFKEASRQTGISIIYNETLFNGLAPVTINLKDATIQDVLKACLKNRPFEYSIEGNLIVIKRKDAKPLPSGGGSSSLDSLPHPPVDIHGRVTDSLGNPLVGASVTVKGSKRGTSTDVLGNFELTNVDADANLMISFTGFAKKEYKVSGSYNFNISLIRSNSPLDQVQIIAYGTTTKRLSTGDITTVSGDEIRRQPVNNPLAAMEGQVSGLSITQTSGLPGSGYNVQIRGQNSLRSAAIGQTEGNNPFYVVDGIPFTSISLQQIGAANGSPYNGNAASPLSLINMVDIQSIEVLKDADATSIYGSRGSNGVILITTKKGQVDKTLVNFNVYTGYGNVAKFQTYMNLPQYLQMRNEAFKNDNAVPQSYDYDVNGVWDSTRYTNWQKMLIGGTAQTTDAQVSVSGGSVNTQFVFGGGYHKETTVLPGDFNNQKGSGYFNLTHSSPDLKFKTGLSVNYAVENNHIFLYDISTAYVATPPDAPAIYEANGQLNWDSGRFDNPYAKFLQTYSAKTTNIITSFYVSYELIKNLVVKLNAGYTQLQMDEVQNNPIKSYNPYNGITTGSANLGNNTLSTWIMEPQLNYNVPIWKGKLSVLIGSTFQHNNQNQVFENATGFPSDNLINILSTAADIQVSNNVSEYSYDALFTRVGYNLFDKYLINISARKDGSSRFGPGKQFATFGAIGAAWIFSKENWFASNPVLSFGKLRSSYGSSGNDQIGDYQYLSSYTSTGYPYQNIVGLIPARLANPQYGWEINRKFEIAMDLGFFKDRFFLSTDYYLNKSSNQLISKAVPLTTGFSSITSNFPATIENTGVEFTLNTTNIHRNNFSWTSSINISFPKNKLVSFPGIENTIYTNYYTVGQPLSIFKGLRYAGVDPATGVYQFISKSNGKATFTPTYPDDYQYVKKIGIQYFSGFQNAIQWKNWNLNFIFQFVKQIGKNNLFDFYPGAFNNATTIFEARWQNPGDQTNIQKFNQDYGLYSAWSNAANSDRAYTDASFIRLKNVALSYEFSVNALKAMHIQHLRFYVQAQNLLTFTKYQGPDPETQRAFPVLRVVTGGVSVSL